MNKRNYQRELDDLINETKETGVRPRLLIQSCCAPCSSHVLEYMNSQFDMMMYFYNPNMDSEEEYEKRFRELERLIAEMPLQGSVSAYKEAFEPACFEAIAKGHENDPERGARCMLCYELRLRKTAEYMKSHPEFDYFATTLTLSPLKNAEALNTIGERIAKEYGIRYLPSDFKKKNGYQRSIVLSKEYSLYRQDYCGCKYSKRDREMQKQQNSGTEVKK